MAKYKAKGLADEIAVYCAFDKIVPIETLIENPKNPNIHPEEQIEILAEIIKKQGWRAPITVSNLSGFIVKGHGRLLAAKLAGLKEVPADFQDYSNGDEEYADLIADNKIAEFSTIDNKQLAQLFNEFSESFDTGLTGYNDKEYAEIMMSFESGSAKPKDEKIGNFEADGTNYKEQYAVIIICEGEEHQKTVYEKIKQDGYNCKVVST